MNCPLCKSKNSTSISIIKTKDIIQLYKNIMLENDIRNEFNQAETIELIKCFDCSLRYFYPLFAGSEAYYDIIQAKKYYLGVKEEYKIAAKFIKPDDKVLDIGCGDGNFFFCIDKNDYTGLESTDTAINICKKQGLNVIKESINKHADKNIEKYDVVSCFQVLEHIKEPYGFLSKCILALKKNGLLIIAVPAFDSYLKYISNALLNMPPHHVTLWSDQSLKSIAKTMHLELEYLQHETLQDAHLKRYAMTLVRRSFSRSLTPELKIIDRSISNYFSNAFSYIFSKLFARGLRNKELRPSGHTVIAIYRKPY